MMDQVHMVRRQEVPPTATDPHAEQLWSGQTPLTTCGLSVVLPAYNEEAVIAETVSYRVAPYRCSLGGRQALTSASLSVGILQRYDATWYQIARKCCEPARLVRRSWGGRMAQRIERGRSPMGLQPLTLACV